MLRIGWASADITPEGAVCLHGQHYPRVSQEVHDPLTATVLALEEAESGEQAVMISCDLVSTPASILQELRQRIRKRSPEVNPDKVFTNGTHTHTGPAMIEGVYEDQGEGVLKPSECADLFYRRVTDAVAEAWENRRPGGLSRAFGHAVVGHNRRAHYFDGSSRMYGKTDREDFECIEGYQDHSLHLLFTWDEARRLTGLVVNLACPSQVTESAYFVSADFWHEAREEIRSRLGGGLFVLPQCAPAGDQSPHFLVYKKEEQFARDGLGLTERGLIGRKIADGIGQVFPAAEKNIQKEPTLRHAVRQVALPRRNITDEDAEAARAELEELENTEPADTKAAARRHRMIARARSVIERHDLQRKDPKLPIETHVLRLGDAALATNPFELFLDYGIRIHARSPAGQNFLVQLACDSLGYLPTRRAVAGGHYGAMPTDNRVGPEGGQVLVEETLRTIHELWSGE